MKKRIHKRRRERCWSCFGLDNSGFHEVCILPPLWDEASQTSKPGVYREVCKWCYIQIQSINQQFTSSHDWRRYWQSYQLARGIYRQRPQNNRQNKQSSWRLIPDFCFFCGGPTGAKDPLRQKTNIHHIIPRREIADPKLANRIENLSKAHKKCHDRFNREHDQSQYHAIPFAIRWSDKELGKNIFKNQTVMLA